MDYVFFKDFLIVGDGGFRMVEELYLDDCYKKNCSSKVEDVDGSYIELDRTIFYPEGGGQPTDKGKLITDNGVEYDISKVKKRKGSIYHKIGDNDLSVDQVVECELDWDRRYTFMKYHTALHILSQAVFSKYGGQVKGNQIRLDKARLDVNIDIEDHMISELENEVNKVIEESRDVSIDVYPREEAEEKVNPDKVRLDLLPDFLEELRLIEVEDYDVDACGGTHVGNTSEIDDIEITDIINKGKDNTRIEISME